MPGVTPTQSQPKIVLYTNHGCPWAHRVHIALRELKLQYDEVLVDLDKPREEWFLKVNPRGLVPAMRYTTDSIDTTLTESRIVAQFLADAHPSHLLPASNSSPTAPLIRARVNFFVDTYFTKINPLMFTVLGSYGAEAMEASSAEVVNAVRNEIEPLLFDAAPFFGGSAEFTMAEVQTASFILRLWAFSDGEIFPTSLAEGLEKLPAFSKWAKACMAHDSLTYIWDEELRTKRIRERLAGAKAAAAKKRLG